MLRCHFIAQGSYVTIWTSQLETVAFSVTVLSHGPLDHLIYVFLYNGFALMITLNNVPLNSEIDLVARISFPTATMHRTPVIVEKVLRFLFRICHVCILAKACCFEYLK
ncbi:hypothetical protein NPIL_688121 [Nephila pilipes]|uniref:Uncharacterized protein n=1 Tax=Nephila pilipes TaxID=299642 RepID=A0A8X6MIX6_NEPPI|nr:hypothetical protein NPIL_688121 [Nephila pilipes]